MLQEWVCQHPMRDVDKLRRRLIDRQTVIDQATDRWRFRLRVMARGGHLELEYLTYITVALHCWSIRFHIFMIFPLIGYVNDDV